MKLLLAFTLIIVTPAVSFGADGVNELVSTCESSKNFKFCQDLQAIKSNVEAMGNDVIKYLKLEIPLGVVGFAVKPQLKLNKGKHQLVIDPQKINYAYSF